MLLLGLISEQRIDFNGHALCALRLCARTAVLFGERYSKSGHAQSTAGSGAPEAQRALGRQHGKWKMQRTLTSLSSPAQLEPMRTWRLQTDADLPASASPCATEDAAAAADSPAAGLPSAGAARRGSQGGLTERCHPVRPFWEARSPGQNLSQRAIKFHNVLWQFWEMSMSQMP